MQVKGNYVEKAAVKYLTEKSTLEEAYHFLKDSGFRCVPVLDESGKKYLGNIYKVHILEYEKSHSLKDSIMVLVENEDEYIFEEASFFKVFFTLKQFPYIAVVDSECTFKGILTHAKVLDILEDSWGVSEGGYAITLGTNEYKGAISKIADVVNKTTTIQSLITLDSNYLYLRRIVVTIPKEAGKEGLDKVTSDLVNKGFRVVHIEQI